MIELLCEGEIFDYNYLSKHMDSINECQLCQGYNTKCNNYIEATPIERFKMYYEGVVLNEPE